MTIKKVSSQDYLKYYYDVPYEGSTSKGKPLRKLKNELADAEFSHNK